MKFSDKYSDFLNYKNKNGLFGKNSRILIALSGGSDSMVLLHFLYTAYTLGDISYVHAFHMNHSLRDEADGEEEFVRKYCEEKNIPVTTVKEDVSSYAKQNRISEETAGRRLRYEHLRSIKEKTHSDLIATAHHADDNAETILMRLIRGTGIKGLGGIHPVSGDIIRPILYLTKDEIYDIAEKENIPFVTDMSNFENDYFRNRVRNTIMPLIKDENPSFAENILRMSEVMRENEEYISALVDEIPVEADGGKVSVRLGDIREKDSFIISELIIKMCSMLTGADNVGYEQIKKVASLVSSSGTERWEYHLPKILISSGDGMLCAEVSGKEKKKISYRYEIIPGESYDFEDIGVKISTKILKKDENFIINSYIKAVDYDKIKGSLYIAPRSDSQKFRPVGRNMTKSVSKFLSDKKVKMNLRNRMPVFSDDEGTVIVGNMEIDERVKITDETKCILEVQTIIY